MTLHPIFQNIFEAHGLAPQGAEDARQVGDVAADVPATKSGVGLDLDRLFRRAEAVTNAHKDYAVVVDSRDLSALLKVAKAAERVGQMCCGDCPIERFDRVAEMFRKDTGFMRPGKDVAAASGMEDDHGKRREAFDAWWKLQWWNFECALRDAGIAP